MQRRQFGWDDALTLAPAAVVLVLFAGLVGTFLWQISSAEVKGCAEPSARSVADGRATVDVAEGGEKPTATGDASASSGPQTVVNIVKNIVGEGMLSLPAGVAAGTGVLGAMVIATGFCALLGYTFSLMGRVCHATGGTTHKSCAEKTGSPRLAQVMAITLVLKTAFTCLSYAIVIGESLSRVLHFFGVSGAAAQKQTTLLAVTTIFLLPLSLQRDLSVLSFTSLVGISGELFVIVFMQVRYMDGSYSPGGAHYAEITDAYRPRFEDGVDYWGTSVGTFVLLGSLSTAYIAHYNGPKFYSQMRHKTVAQFNRVVTVAFAFSLSVYLWVMTVGYLTFGEKADGLILNNYSEKDAGAAAARVAILLAVVFGFPLAFTALRDSALSVLSLDGSRRDVWVVSTLSLMTPIVVGGCAIADLGLVNSLGGAIFGALIVLVFPGLLCVAAVRSKSGGGGEFTETESTVGWVLVALGVCLCLFGSTIVLLLKFAPHLLKA